MYSDSAKRRSLRNLSPLPSVFPFIAGFFPFGLEHSKQLQVPDERPWLALQGATVPVDSYEDMILRTDYHDHIFS